jgi:hypothetical protein
MARAEHIDQIILTLTADEAQGLVYLLEDTDEHGLDKDLAVTLRVIFAALADLGLNG